MHNRNPLSTLISFNRPSKPRPFNVSNNAQRWGPEPHPKVTLNKVPPLLTVSIHARALTWHLT